MDTIENILPHQPLFFVCNVALVSPSQNLCVPSLFLGFPPEDTPQPGKGFQLLLAEPNESTCLDDSARYLQNVPARFMHLETGEAAGFPGSALNFPF